MGPFDAAAGTYEVSGGNLICRPAVAKNPQVMVPGPDQLFLFRLEETTLTITDVRNGNGPVANPMTSPYARVERKESRSSGRVSVPLIGKSNSGLTVRVTGALLDRVNQAGSRKVPLSERGTGSCVAPNGGNTIG